MMRWRTIAPTNAVGMRWVCSRSQILSPASLPTRGDTVRHYSLPYRHSRATKEVRDSQAQFRSRPRKNDRFFKHSQTMHDRRDSRYTKAAIQAAVMDKNLPYLRECIANHASLRDRGENLLTLAASYRGRALVADLISRGENPNVCNRIGVTPLQYACIGNDVALTLHLLQSGADPFAADERGLQPIHKAAYTNSHRCIALLLNGGVNVEAKDNDGETPLHIAATQGAFRSVQLLLRNGASVNVQHVEGGCPLHHAAHGGHSNVVKLLLEFGANPVLRDNLGILALHRACQLPGSKGCVHQLLAAAPESLDDSENDHGMCPVHFAAFAGNLDALNTLLSRGAQVEPLGPNGHVPLMLAAQSGDVGCMRLLLEYGADVRKGNDSGMTPLHVVPSGKAAELLIGEGAHADAADDFGMTPLHNAAQRGDDAVVEALLKRGASVDAVTRGNTPLHMATIAESPETLAMLLEGGANVDTQNELGDTALHIAIHQGDVTSAVLLLEHDARVDIEREDGRTPFDLLEPSEAGAFQAALSNKGAKNSNTDRGRGEGQD